MAIDTRPKMDTAATDLACASDLASTGSLELIDLLNDLEALASLLIEQVEGTRAVLGPDRIAEHVLDAFLLAAGMNQVVEDHIHRGMFRSREASPGTRGLAVRALNGLGAAVETVRPVFERRATRFHVSLERLVTRLARAVVDHTKVDDETFRLAHVVAAQTSRLPQSLSRSILRLPDSFRAFDQEPEDCARLVEMFRARWPDVRRRLLVVGVRTSGSYLAPLTAACLQTAGFPFVDWITFRPGQTWAAAERARVKRLAQHGGLTLLVDDPPVTGGKLAASAATLQRLGVEPDSIVMLVPLLGDEAALPQRLLSKLVVLLPWEHWAIHERLTDPAVREALTRHLVGRTVRAESGRTVQVSSITGVQSLPLEPITDLKSRPLVRSHLRTARRVLIRDNKGRDEALGVYIKGTGLGYFGRHSIAVSRRLQGQVPDTYGSSGGLLFRTLLPEGARLDAPGRADAAAIVAYVLARTHALPATQDKSRRMNLRHTGWELAANWLGAGLGPIQSLVGPLMTSYTRKVLRPPRASVIDGSTAIPNWFRDSSGAMLKADYDERAFSVWDTYCYDAVYDLAIAAADCEFRCEVGEVNDFGDLLRTQFESETGDQISDARWYLYQMIHLGAAQWHFERLLRDGPGHLQARDGQPALTPQLEPEFEEMLRASCENSELAMSRIHNAFLAQQYLADMPNAAGPLCEVDVETCLEADWLRSGSLTSTGAVVLRSLLAHGYRPVLRTRRSVRELRHRCAVYRAAGGFASDGAINPSGGEVVASTKALSEITSLLGHAAGRCPQCRPPRFTWEMRFLLSVFEMRQERGLRRMAAAGGLARWLVSGRVGQ